MIIIRSSGIFPCYSPSPAEIPVYVSHFKTSQFFSFISFIPFRLLLLQMCYCRPVITALLPASPGLLLLLFILPARCIIQIFFFFFFFFHCTVGLIIGISPVGLGSSQNTAANGSSSSSSRDDDVSM